MSVIFVRCGSSCFWLVSSSMSIRDSIIISPVRSSFWSYIISAVIAILFISSPRKTFFGSIVESLKLISYTLGG